VGADGAVDLHGQDLVTTVALDGGGADEHEVAVGSLLLPCSAGLRSYSAGAVINGRAGTCQCRELLGWSGVGGGLVEVAEECEGSGDLFG
jgi:hypothetical protein